MMLRARLVFSSSFFGAAALVAACSSSSTSSSSPDAGEACQPPPLSCDLGATSENRVDLVNDCVESTATVLANTCETSIDRCNRSSGIAIGCAFGPDGAMYIANVTDNSVLSGNGWRFTQPFAGSFPAAYNSVPQDERATDADTAQCFQAACFPTCGGTTFHSAGVVCADAGGD